LIKIYLKLRPKKKLDILLALDDMELLYLYNFLGKIIKLIYKNNLVNNSAKNYRKIKNNILKRIGYSIVKII
jgi:hypothetical protein